jgi:hypothetical protein
MQRCRVAAGRAKRHLLRSSSIQRLRVGTGLALYPPNVASLAGADEPNDEKKNELLEDSNMKKLIPFLGLAVLSLSLFAPTSAHALLDLFDQGGSGGGAPEIDPSALGSAFALVMGGAVMLSDRFRRR